MKILQFSKPVLSARKSPFQWGLSLIELMVTMVIFSMVVLALVSVHLFGMKYDSVVGSALGASDQSRMALGQLLSEIRKANRYYIGYMTGTNFTGDTAGAAQQGNTIKLYWTQNGDTNHYAQYALDTASSELRRTETGASGYDVTAQYLTNTTQFGANSNIFVAEDPVGAVQTTVNAKWVIHVTLQFYQYKYPKTLVGPGRYYDYYKMEFKAAPRAAD
jgi:prepilin-type N-terminal cleavage/methylation domain-containing protein